MSTHHGTTTNQTRFIVSVQGTPIQKDLGIRSPGRQRGTNESFCYVASRYVGGVETRQAANRPGLDDCRPTQDSRMRGDASRGRKSFMFESKFCQSTSSFLQKRRSFLKRTSLRWRDPAMRLRAVFPGTFLLLIDAELQDERGSGNRHRLHLHYPYAFGSLQA